MDSYGFKVIVTDSDHNSRNEYAMAFLFTHATDEHVES